LLVLGCRELFGLGLMGLELIVLDKNNLVVYIYVLKKQGIFLI
jgi:hypothetical protein